jgi:hypothetical protein
VRVPGAVRQTTIVIKLALRCVHVERRTCNPRSRPLPCCVAGSGRCSPEDVGGHERYMNALEVHGEHEFLDWIETLRECQIDLNDLRVEVDEWLVWLEWGFAGVQRMSGCRSLRGKSDAPSGRLRCKSAACSSRVTDRLAPTTLCDSPTPIASDSLSPCESYAWLWSPKICIKTLRSQTPPGSPWKRRCQTIETSKIGNCMGGATI